MYNNNIWETNRGFLAKQYPISYIYVLAAVMNSHQRMKTPFLFFLFCLYNSIAFGQDTLGSQRIDSIIQSREKSFLYEYIKLTFANEDTFIKKMGSLTRMYKYANGKIPYARFDIWISAKDTEQITFYFYDGEELIKAGTITPTNSHSSFYQQIAYFNNGKVIHCLTSDDKPFETNYDFYLNRSREFIQNIKRKPVRFTL